MFENLKNLMDLNKNGKTEWWEMGIFAVGFIAAGVVVSMFV